MKVRVGRAPVADPDLLVVDAAQLDDALLPPERFNQSFATQYPWRAPVWAKHQGASDYRLRAPLREPQT